MLTGRSTPRYLTVLPDGTSLSDRSMQKVRGREVGHRYVERRLCALGARPLRAGMNPAGWLTDALDDVHAVRLRHRGNLRYAMLTSRAARRHVVLRLPIDHNTHPPATRWEPSTTSPGAASSACPTRSGSTPARNNHPAYLQTTRQAHAAGHVP